MRKILFVDDELNILDGLRRLLHAKRHEWDMTFVDSGERAVQELNTKRYDVLVSDMRMPGIDGAQLLHIAHDDHPETIRIILSGYTELEVALRAVPIAHQFLTKPCDADLLSNTIERAASLQVILNDDRLQKVVSGVESLPSVPTIHYELTKLLTDPDTSLVDVSAVVERDPAMSAKVLQLVNSAFFGAPRRVSKVSEATALLGTNMLKNLTLTVSVLCSATRSAKATDIEQLQRRSLKIGKLAMNMLEAKQQKEDAFTAGVLLRVGRLVVASEMADAYGRILGLERLGISEQEAERKILGVDCAQVGAYLLGLWGLPYPIVEAVAHYGSPTHVEQRELDVLGAVHIANALVLGAEGTSIAVDDAYLAQLQVDQAKVAEWRAILDALEAA